MQPLDLYAKIEPLIGFDEQYEKLYKLYLEWLQSLHVKCVLDVGCGNGKFLQHLKMHGFDALGIDRSEHMVQRALALGVNAQLKELDTFAPETFDSVVAIADVLNYMSVEELEDFLNKVAYVLKKGGYFLCDVNTLYGFENVADGVMCKENETFFLCIEANYAEKKLQTLITLFEKQGDVYRKEQGAITQYFHPQSFFKKQKVLRFLSQKGVGLFSQEHDKTLMLFQKH